MVIDVGFYVAPKYNKAKYGFCWSGADSASEDAANLRVGGTLHAHMPGTYYLIAHNKVSYIS